MKIKHYKTNFSTVPSAGKPCWVYGRIPSIVWLLLVFAWFILNGCTPGESPNVADNDGSKWIEEATLILNTQNADSLAAVAREFLKTPASKHNGEEQRSVYGFMIKAFSITEQPDSILNLAQLVCREAESSKDTLEVAKIIYMLDFEGQSDRHLKNMERWVAQSATYMAIRPDHELAGNIFNKYGLILNFGERYEDAGKWLIKAYQYYQEREDYLGLYNVCLNLGNNYSDIKSTGDTRKYYLLALEYAQQTKILQDDLSALNNLGIFYRPLNPDSAILFFTRLIQLAPKQSRYTLQAHYNLGNVYFEIGDLTKAMRQFDWVKSSASQLELHEGVVMGDLGRSVVLRKMGNYKESIAIQQKSMQYADSVQNGFLKTHIRENLEDTYAGMGDYQNAYPILKSLQAHKDSILNIDKQVAIHELELFYQAEQKKLEQQNLAATLANQKLAGRIRLAIASSIIIILTLLSLYYYKRSKEKVLEIIKLKERNNLLAELEQMKTQQAEFLEQIVEQQKAELLTISQENELIRQEFSSGNLQDSILAENGSRVISAAGNPLYWENLAIKFNLIFPGLVDRLKEKHPRLSPSDIQYCMLLKLNIPLKDIASILNITLQGVYKKKYRLEEKMGIDASLDDINILIQTLK